MSDSHHDQKRAFYRLRYPEAARPGVRIDGRDGAVAELSEGGARIVLAGDGVGPGQRLVGVVRFTDGGTARIAGEVQRLDGDEVVLILSVGVSLKRMLAEQQRLLRDYPSHFDR